MCAGMGRFGRDLLRGGVWVSGGGAQRRRRRSTNNTIFSGAKTMKKVIGALAGIAASVLLAPGASADGMRSLKDAPGVATSCGTTAVNWSGAYAGINVGAGNYRSTVALEDILGIASQREEMGFAVGGAIGMNWQRCNTVLGIEAELNWTDVDRAWGINLAGLGAPPPFANPFNAKSSIEWYGAVKARAGYAMDSMLLYLTAGIAFAEIEHSGLDTIVRRIGFNSSDTRFGWVVGGGAEYALTKNISWRNEVTYTRFEDQDFNLNVPAGLLGPAAAAIKLNAQDELWLLRTGLNFRF